MIAYKCDNRSWAIQGEAVLIVDDINDNSPTVDFLVDIESEDLLEDIDLTVVSIMEETYLTLPISRLIVNDIDLVI